MQIVSLLKRLNEKQIQLVVINRGEHYRIRVTTKSRKRQQRQMKKTRVKREGCKGDIERQPIRDSTIGITISAIH